MSGRRRGGREAGPAFEWMGVFSAHDKIHDGVRAAYPEAWRVFIARDPRSRAQPTWLVWASELHTGAHFHSCSSEGRRLHSLGAAREDARRLLAVVGKLGVWPEWSTGTTVP